MESEKIDVSGIENYLENVYDQERQWKEPDTEFLQFWHGVVEYGQVNSMAEALNVKVCPKRPVSFREPDQVHIEIYDSVAGQIPIIYIENQKDFEDFIVNLVHKGIRPEHIGEVGASFISGKTTRFIVLSYKPYSNVTAKEMGLDEKTWHEKSMIIRREHECCHYYSKQLYGMARNNLHDEIIADFFGIYGAFGYYRAEYFLRFIGVIEGSGNRITCYVEGMTEAQVEKLKKVAEIGARNLERWSHSEEFLGSSQEQRMQKLYQLGLMGICT